MTPHPPVMPTRIPRALRLRRPEHVLRRLRERLREREQVPLPAGWDAELLCHADAAGHRDVVVTGADSMTPSGAHIAVVMVRPDAADDESARLLLGGAVTGLLDHLPSDRLLPAIAGYAGATCSGPIHSAAYVAVDSSTGNYVVRAYGWHVWARLSYGSGKWSTSGVTGLPAHGAGPDVGHDVVDAGVLDRGDVLLLLLPALAAGGASSHFIDRVLGRVERMLTGDPVGGLGRGALADLVEESSVFALRRG